MENYNDKDLKNHNNETHSMWSKGEEEFLSRSVEDFKKMKTTALSERQMEERRWRKVVRLLYKDHYLIEEDECLAYSEEISRIWYVCKQNYLNANTPYTSKIIADPNNSLSPALNIVEKLNANKIGFLGKIDLLNFEKYLNLFREEVDSLNASNDTAKDIIQKLYADLRETGNACAYVDFDDIEKNKFRFHYVPLNSILFYKNTIENRATYFFRDFAMTLDEFEKYFPSEEALNKCLRNYSTLKEPENRYTKKDIKIVEVSYYCEEKQRTIIRHYFDNELNDFIENNEEDLRVRNYQVFWLYQINAENRLYGRIDDIDYQILTSLEQTQKLYYHLIKMRQQIENPKFLEIANIFSEEPLETNFSQGVNQTNEIRKYNQQNQKNLSLNPETLTALGGVLRNQTTAPVDLPQYLVILEEQYTKAREKLITALNFNEAQKRELLTMNEIRETSVTEFETILYQTSLDKRKLETLESFTSSFYVFTTSFYIRNVAEELAIFYNKHGKKSEDLIGRNQDTLQDNAFYDIIALQKSSLTDEELKTNPFAFLLERDPRITQIKESFNQLVEAYQNAENDNEKEEIQRIMLDIEKQYPIFIQEEALPYLLKYKIDDKLEKLLEKRGEDLVLASPLDFIIFVLTFNKIAKNIKFKLASSEAKVLANQNNQNYIRFIQTALPIINQIKDVAPEEALKVILSFDFSNGFRKIGEDQNLQPMLKDEREVNKMIEEMQQRQLEQQRQLAEINNPQPTQ